MSAVTPPTQPAASQQAAVEAALVLLERMGLSPADLVAAPRDRAVVPTFAEYVPVMSAAVTCGCRLFVRAGQEACRYPWRGAAQSVSSADIEVRDPLNGGSMV